MGRNHKTVVTSKYQKLQTCTLPKAILLQIISSGYMPALTVLIVLYETCFLDGKHKNPITLTSESLRPYKVSRGQKQQALKILEQYGAVTVIRCNGKNPAVKLNWKLPWDWA